VTQTTKSIVATLTMHGSPETKTCTRDLSLEKPLPLMVMIVPPIIPLREGNTFLILAM